jgi:hypothetical protein
MTAAGAQDSGKEVKKMFLPPSYPVASRPPPYFPDEIIQNIMEQLCIDWDGDSYDLPTLAACALVCRRFLPLVRVRMYSSIWLGHCSNEPETINETYWACYWPFADLQSVLDDPVRRVYIRRVYVEPGYEWSPEGPHRHFSFDALRQALCKLESISTLSIGTSSSDYADETPVAPELALLRLDGIRRLELSIEWYGENAMHASPFDSLAERLSSMSNLTSLTIVLPLQFKDVEVSQFEGMRLRSLSLSIPDEYPHRALQKVFDGLLFTSYPTLAHLELRSNVRLLIDLSKCRNLSTFEWRSHVVCPRSTLRVCPRSGLRDKDNSHITAMRDLASLPMKHLTVTWYLTAPSIYHSISEGGQEMAMDVLRRAHEDILRRYLPGTVQVLSITRLSPDHVCEILAHSRSKLKRLNLFTKGARRQWTPWDILRVAKSAHKAGVYLTLDGIPFPS